MLGNAQKHIQEVAGYGYNLLDRLRSTVQVDHALVDPHFKAVPRLGAFAARRLATSHMESLCWHTYGTLDLGQLGLLCPSNQIRAHCGKSTGRPNE